METTVYSILLVAADVSRASEFSSKIRIHFSSAPISVDVVEDGSRALYALSKKNYFLVISDVDLPIMDGVSLVRELRRMDGGIAIFLLATRSVTVEEQGIDIVKVPIENWKDLFRKIEYQLPQQMRVKYGLVSQDKELAEMLTNYAREKIGDTPSTWTADSPVLQIPTYFDASSNSETQPKIDSREQALQRISERVEKQPSKALIFSQASEILMLATLLIVTSYLFSRNYEEDSLMRQVRYVLLVVTSVSFFGYFVAKFIERKVRS